MSEYPTSNANYSGPYDHDFDHPACLHQPGAVVTPADSLVDNIAALHKLAEDILNPEVYGFSVTADVRDAARHALGFNPFEGEGKQSPHEEPLRVKRSPTGVPEFTARSEKLYTQDEVDAIIARQSGK